LSNFDESFGLVYLEAQSCGCPVIGRNNAGAKEAINNEKSGFLTNSQEDVLDILKNKKYLDLNHDEIVGFANQFSLTKQVRILESFV